MGGNNGLTSQLTAKQIAEVRECYAAWKRVKPWRMRLLRVHGLSPKTFDRIGQGITGRRPLPEGE